LTLRASIYENAVAKEHLTKGGGWKRKQNYEKKEKRKKRKCDLDAAAAQETRGAPCPAAHSPNSVPWYIYYTKTHYVEDF